MSEGVSKGGVREVGKEGVGGRNSRIINTGFQTMQV